MCIWVGGGSDVSYQCMGLSNIKIESKVFT